MLARERELERDGVELPAANGVRRFGEKRLEKLPHLGGRRKRRVVVELDVGDDRDLRPEPLDGAIGLVSLDDEPAFPRAGVAAELRHLAADEPGRIVTELTQRKRDHRRRGRLAVRAGDDDRPAQRDELVEEIGARTSFDLRRVRGGHDDLPASARRRLPAEIDVDAVQGAEVGRLVPIPARDLGSPGPGEEGVGGEAGAADADEVDAPSGEREPAHLTARLPRAR